MNVYVYGFPNESERRTNIQDVPSSLGIAVYVVNLIPLFRRLTWLSFSCMKLPSCPHIFGFLIFSFKSKYLSYISGSDLTYKIKFKYVHDFSPVNLGWIKIHKYLS